MPKSPPSSPFYWSDYYRDTRGLDPATKGIWMDMLCRLHWSSTRGRLTLSTDQWLLCCGCTLEQLRGGVEALKNQRVAETKRWPNGNLTVINRRMVREEKAKENNRKRQQMFYAKHQPNGSLTPSSRQPNTVSSSSLSSSSSEKREKNPPLSPFRRDKTVDNVVSVECPDELKPIFSKLGVQL